jgi:hypothetical protein
VAEVEWRDTGHDAADLNRDGLAPDDRATDNTGTDDLATYDIDTDDLDEAVIDEDMLRDLVARIVREELQGHLGERITRNVRKLIRAEIARALASRSFD